MRRENRRWFLAPLFLAGLGVILPFKAAAQDEAAEIERPTREQVRAQLRPVRRALAAPSAASDAFQVQYTLRGDADLSVTILDVRRMPIRTFQVAAGAPGALAGEDSLTLWDGKDSQGGDAPAGEYWASLSCRYGDGSLENLRFRLEKP